MSLPDRIIGALRRLIREELSGRVNGSGEVTAGAYLGQWEYTVAEATDTTVDVRAADSACPLPDIPKVPIFPGVAGVRYRPAVGSIVGIGFANGDPTKPRVLWADQTVPYTAAVDAAVNPNAKPAEVSGLLEVGPSATSVEVAGGGPAIARVNDQVNGGSLTAASATLTLTNGAGGVTTFAFAIAGPNIQITPVGTGALTGLISTGSAKGTCG